MRKLGDFFLAHPTVLLLTGVVLGFGICYYGGGDVLSGMTTPAAPAAPAPAAK